MPKELSMTSARYALLTGVAAIAIALLAVFEIIPAQVAQFAPVALVPFIIRRSRNACALREGRA
jgi:hypothetical protein